MKNKSRKEQKREFWVIRFDSNLFTVEDISRCTHVAFIRKGTWKRIRNRKLHN